MLQDDTSAYLGDFGTTAVVAGVSVAAIFDAGYALGNVGPIGMAGNQPMLTLATASVPAAPEGQSVVVGGASYLIAAHEADGTGMSRLLLEVSA